MQRAFSKTAAFNTVTHIIFDLDGLILNTENFYPIVRQHLLQQFGKEYDPSLDVLIKGKFGIEIAEILVNVYELPITAEECVKLMRDQYESIMPTAQILPGAERLLKHLHQNKIPIAVATSSSKDSYELKTRNHVETFSLFHHIVCGGSDPDVKKGKPSPDIFLVCASRFREKPAPERCLVFEDAPNGVLAAVSANMQVVMVPEESVPEEHRRKATLVLKSLVDFNPELFGLPSFKFTQLYKAYCEFDPIGIYKNLHGF